MTRPLHISTSRALYHASRRFGWHDRRNGDFTPGIVGREGGRVVTMASQFPPYAVSRHGLGGIRHSVRAVFLAWHRGRLVGTLVRCWCGGRLVTADLIDADTPARGDCGLCRLRVPDGQRAVATVQILVAVAA
jgi:hypothetical protein